MEYMNLSDINIKDFKLVLTPTSLDMLLNNMSYNYSYNNGLYNFNFVKNGFKYNYSYKKYNTWFYKVYYKLIIRDKVKV